MADTSQPGNPLYRACVKEAAARGQALMQSVVERAVEAMPQRASITADVVERNLLLEAARVLASHKAALCMAYPQALLSEFAHAIAGDNRKAAGVSFESLELMGDDQVQESVEVVRTQHSVLHAVEADLTEFNMLVCAAQGLKTVQEQRNPMRPEMYVRALRTSIQASPVPASARRRWLLHMGEALGVELAKTYQELSQMLRSGGVTAAGFSIVNASPAPGPGAAAAGAAAEAASGPSQEDHRTLLNVRELRRLLSGELDLPPVAATAGAAPNADFSLTVPAAYDALKEMKQVEQVMQRLRERRAVRVRSDAPQQPDQVASAMAEAVTPGQKLALEVVDLMVEGLATDVRLLPAVQQAVRELEPALSRLALADPRFFSDKRHPARELLDELTQRSLAWSSEDAPGFQAFMQPLQQAVEVLARTRAPGPEPFAFALESLRDAWGTAEQRGRRHREKAVRTLLQAEQRNLLATRIAQQMRDRPGLAAVPPFVSQFITGPWTQVMAQSRLADESGASDPAGNMLLVTDLMWSVQPALTAGNLQRLARVVPRLVQHLRQGLRSIRYPEAETERFLRQLGEVHAQALSPGDAPRPRSLATTMSREELEAMFGEQADAWLAPAEARESGFMPTDLNMVPPPLFQATAPLTGSSAPSMLAPAAEPLADVGLTTGAWVDLFADGEWGRWQFTWASPHGTLFLFTREGAQRSMSRQLVQKLLAAGALRLVAAQAVVEGALDAVAQEALRNSVDLKL